jgi:hypothetical protein
MNNFSRPTKLPRPLVDALCCQPVTRNHLLGDFFPSTRNFRNVMESAMVKALKFSPATKAPCTHHWCFIMRDKQQWCVIFIEIDGRVWWWNGEWFFKRSRMCGWTPVHGPQISPSWKPVCSVTWLPYFSAELAPLVVSPASVNLFKA